MSSHRPELEPSETNVPDSPAVKPWIRVAKGEGNILFEYGGRLVELRGLAVEFVANVLLPVLKGQVSREAILSGSGAGHEAAVANTLELLQAEGLLTEGNVPADTPEGRSTLFVAATSSFSLDRSMADLQTKLTATPVSLVGSSSTAAQICELLRQGGLEAAQRTWPQRASEVESTFVIAAPDAEELSGLLNFNREMLQAGITWLPVLPFDGYCGVVGPLVRPHETACYQCYQIRRSLLSGYTIEQQEQLQSVPIRVPATPWFEAIVAGLATNVAVRWLGASDPFLPGVAYAVEAAPVVKVASHDVLLVPRCPACSRLKGFPLPWYDGDFLRVQNDGSQ